MTGPFVVDPPQLDPLLKQLRLPTMRRLRPGRRLYLLLTLRATRMAVR